MKLTRSDGFTLVEILVALTIFSVAMLGLAAGTINVIRNNQTSHLRASAINLAQAKIEEFRAMTRTAFSSVAAGYASYTTCPGTTPLPYLADCRITSNSPVAGVSRIDVRVSWTDYTNRSVTVSGSMAN
ncbi:MAG TPA: prepilin-type N-terminal cleavage/methylation domain-containing protein [Candidatus Eisenbacteria bacterium]|nr:prepilin-type N-terminal cleavage/methylation domain-containing protein [Candidatus Eisenbacteria bacterium]